MHVVQQLLLVRSVVIVFLDQETLQPFVAARHDFGLGVVNEMKTRVTEAVKRDKHPWIGEQSPEHRHERLRGRLGKLLLNLFRTETTALTHDFLVLQFGCFRKTKRTKNSYCC